MSKNRELLKEFAKYCEDHPEERFWQALRNWSQFSFIYAGELRWKELKDTFYLEGKHFDSPAEAFGVCRPSVGAAMGYPFPKGHPK